MAPASWVYLTVSPPTVELSAGQVSVLGRPYQSTTGEAANHRNLSSRFWRQEIRSQVSAGLVPSRGCGEPIPGPPPGFWQLQQPLACGRIA